MRSLERVAAKQVLLLLSIAVVVAVVHLRAFMDLWSFLVRHDPLCLLLSLVYAGLSLVPLYFGWQLIEKTLFMLSAVGKEVRVS